MNGWTYALNTAWMWNCLRERAAFQAATRDVANCQANLLHNLLRRNGDTDYGSTFNFQTIRDVNEFQKRVPLTTYEDYAPQVDRIASGAQRVLTDDPVRLFEPTSGTTDGEKLIPYTATLRRQFQRAIAAWIGDLFQQRPAVRSGRAYWSISPAFGPQRKTPAGIPIGFDDDTAYLGSLERLFVHRLLAVPASVAKLTSIRDYRYATLVNLLLAEDLALISVWNPTFLTVLLDSLDASRDRILHDLRCERLSLDSADSAHPQLRVTSKRRAAIDSLLRTSTGRVDQLRQLWPKLAVISCWTDASASIAANDLGALFPEVEIQPKGLMATEAAVSFPLAGRCGAALALRSHFFEFREFDQSDASQLRLAHQLEQGKSYEVVVTTGGGLYRYQLQDLVQVVGFENDCPLLRFLGKANRVSDLVGEKLGEHHVATVLTGVVEQLQLGTPFTMLVPTQGRPSYYCIYLHGKGLDSDRGAKLARAVEVGLCENPYYRHAVTVGQLAPLRYCVLDDSAESPWLQYERLCLQRGQKPGDIKPTVLDVNLQWQEILSTANSVTVETPG